MKSERKRPDSLTAAAPSRTPPGRRVLVGVQWDASCWSRAGLLVDRVLRVLHAIPLHWNLPAFPTADGGSSATVEVLRERLASAGDALLAMGCTGACQPALTLAELDREIAWGLRNPWATGLFDVLGRRPAAAVPRLPDFDRPAAAPLFLRHGLSLVGTSASGRPLAFWGHHGIRVFPYTRVPSDGVSRPSLEAELRHLLALSGDVFVMIDFSALPPAPAAAASLIETAAERVLASGRDVVTLADAARGEPGSRDADVRCSTEAAEWRRFPAPSLRRRLAAAEALRSRRRRRSDETRTILSLLSAGTPDPPAAPPPPSQRHTDRGLIAHMQGEAVLSGDRFDVRLAGGRFCGLARGREALTPHRPASSWVRVNGRFLIARGRSAFSFEGDDGTGLREDLVLEPGGSLVVDYAFRGEQPFLAVEAAYTFPALPAGTVVDEWAPLALALAEAPGRREIPVSFDAPDGSSGTCLVAERDGWRSAAGSRFRVRTGPVEVQLATGSEGSGPWGLFLFRVVKVGPGRRVLEVNPFGAVGPLPAESLTGSQGTFAFTIGLGGS